MNEATTARSIKHEPLACFTQFFGFLMETQFLGIRSECGATTGMGRLVRCFLFRCKHVNMSAHTISPISPVNTAEPIAEKNINEPSISPNILAGLVPRKKEMASFAMAIK